MKNQTKNIYRASLIAVMLLSLLLGACSRPSQATPTPDTGLIQTFAVATFAIGLTQTAMVQPTATETITPSPTPSASPSPTALPTTDLVVLPTSSCNGLTFLSDVTIPDNTKLAPGEAFTKTWRVKNSGTCAWEAGFQVKFFSGSAMGGKAYTLPRTVTQGNTIDISIDMVAPATAGSYTGNWRMADDVSGFFGDSFYVLIVVEDGNTTATATKTSATLTPTATPSATPVPSDTTSP